MCDRARKQEGIMPVDVESFTKRSFRNRAAVVSSGCGCYFCTRAFHGGEVEEWVDDGETALCPFCGIDAVLPGVTDAAALAAGLERWFTRPSES